MILAMTLLACFQALIMRKKCSADVFASIISAVLNKKITPVGRTGNEIGDILFNKAELLNAIRIYQ